MKPQRDHSRLQRCYLGLKKVISGPTEVTLSQREAIQGSREVLWAHREVPQACLGFPKVSQRLHLVKNVHLQHNRYSANNLI